MKRTIMALCAFLAMTTALLAGPTPRIRIVATTFPLFDWTRNVLGKQLATVELIQLQDNGVDLHNFQPTVQDIARISQCDLFLFVGGESDEWTEKALRISRNPRRIALNLIKELGNTVQEEEPLEGMEEHHYGKEEHNHGKDGHHDDDDHDDDEHEIDEHVWLSLRCAASLCQAIAARLSELDREHAAEYQSNCRAYVEKLQELDKRYKVCVESSPLKTLLFADRFPFRYMAKDYGLTCYAAFSGCSAETEASFKTIAFLAGKVNECKLPAILVLEERRHKIAETVLRTAKNKNVRILAMNSLQSTTSRDAAAGKDYLDAMERNLTVLKHALGNKD
ncbi:MAG: zinc ABC transporter substrate-binding protein [Victivallales bacterium]|nr:zinc ABC transporter substrate-binding protein [Victivallales bacterium]